MQPGQRAGKLATALVPGAGNHTTEAKWGKQVPSARENTFFFTSFTLLTIFTTHEFHLHKCFSLAANQIVQRLRNEENV